jgi:hypothetical protein
VTLERPDVPRRVELAIERALAKDPADRFPSMAAFCAELEACLQEARSSEDTGATGILPVVVPDRSTGGGHRRRRRWLVALLLLIVLLAVAGTVAFLLTRGENGTGTTGTTGAPNIPVRAVISYDPYGNNHTEMPQLVPNATDGNVQTYWSTEQYYDPNGSLFGKPGVGIVLDAGQDVAIGQMTVISDTPGYTAEFRYGDSEEGPFSNDSPSVTCGDHCVFELGGAKARYFLLWITNRGDNVAVHINEVTAQ